MPSGLILGIETSCDETAAAVVERGARTLSSVVASQIATHARYGGVVPELASREHLRAIVPVVRAALAEAGLSLSDLDAIAVTSGPGLAGALLVGITYAKALAYANNLPLIAVNHLEGHIHAVLLQERESDRESQRESAALAQTEVAPSFSESASADSERVGPHDLDQGARTESALALVVSGGHTHLFLASPTDGVWTYTLIGRTVDDAAGEAFDKVAKLLSLGYPGGPWIDALAKFGNPKAVPFSLAQIKTKAHLGGKPAPTKAARTAPIARLDPHFLFSFSGIKTAVLRYVELHGLRDEARARVSRLYPVAPSFSESASADSGRVGDHSRLLPVAPSFSESASSDSERVGDHIRKSTPHTPQSHEEALALCPQPTLDLIASFQHAVIGDLMKKTFAAAEAQHVARILVTGGVAANSELRARFTAEAARRGLRVAFPTLALSTDNAAMIAAAAWPRLLARDFASPDLTAEPSLALS
jgi:tRNA N6-adenosine threonylcarbamoyltransferase